MASLSYPPVQSPAAQRVWTRDAWCLLAVLGFSAVYMALRLHVGWIPDDEGTLSSSAMRVYNGQLPQRDFAEIYTGGLSFLNATAFRIFGTNLFSMRLMAMSFFLPMLAAVYYAARRFTEPIIAGLVTLTAMTWSFPSHPTGMPSWYNLFFAVYGLAALLRFLEVRRRRWLFLAGVCGGASILIKIIGLYYVAGVLLFLVFVEQSSARGGVKIGSGAERGNSLVYRVVCGGSLLVFLAMICRLIGPRMHFAEAYHFVRPAAMCVAVLFGRERKIASASSGERFATLFRLGAPFLAGLAVPVVVFLMPYVLSHSVGTLLHGVFGSVSDRVAGLAGMMATPGVDSMVYGIATVAVLLLGLYSPIARSRWIVAAIGVGLAATLAVSSRMHGVQDTWLMAGMVTPLVVLLGAIQILGSAEEASSQRLMLLMGLASICSLVQFPLPYITYFCYVAPLTLLAAVALVASRPQAPGKPLLVVLLLYFLGYGFFALDAKHVFNPDLDTRHLYRLSLPRAGGLKIDATTPGYEDLVPLLEAHSDNGWLYAANDCPELYFLSGLRDPTSDDTGASAVSTAGVLAALQSGKLHVVALKDHPVYATERVDPVLRAAVEAALPQHKVVGRFSVYWR